MAIVAGAVVLAAATLAVYWPALRGGFLFDDESLLFNSAAILAADGLYRIWFTTQPIDYWPLTNSSFWIEWRLWGMAPVGYHVTNVALHTLSAVTLWAILRRLAVPGAWLAAAVFALHPVNVQSVAWIAQRKNTLAALFFLLSILAYLRSERTARQATWYGLSVLAFLFAMLSKGSVAMLPGVLLLLAWWQRGGVNLADVRRVLPFVVIALSLTAVNVWFQARMEGGVRDVTAVERMLGAGAVVWFYLYKALAPLDLVFMYPQWRVRAGDWAWWLPLAAAAVLTLVLAARRRQPVSRAVLFGWLFFTMALLPVMGLIDVYFMKYALVADHYQYLAIIAVAAGVAAAVHRWLSRPLAAAAGAAALVALGVLTWRQAHLYASAETLYRATLAKNPDAAVIHNNLGATLLERETTEEAVRHLREAVRLQPDLPSAHNNLCNAAARLGSILEAITECTEILRREPQRATAHTSLGIALAAAGRFDEARAALETAARLNPASVQTQAALAGVLEELGDKAGAERAYRAAIRLAPDTAEHRWHLADLLGDLGRQEEAIAEYRQALARDSRIAEVHNNLGVALARTGRLAEAIEQVRTAVSLQPDNPEFRANLTKLTSR